MKEVIWACRHLFGVSEKIARVILPQLEPEDVNVASAKALRAQGSIKPLFGWLFRSSRRQTIESIADARHILLRYANLKKDAKDSLRPHQIEAAKGYYRGKVPTEVLRFGMYLYYRGAITWEALEDALEWQRRSRPLMGQVAMREGMISPQGFARVLCAQNQGSMFGETAQRLGLITPVGVQEIAHMQSRYDCPIGRFFVDSGLLDPSTVEQYHRDLHTHNRICAN
jgi:hypothetical protein